MKAEIAILRAVAKKLSEGCTTFNSAFACSDRLLRVIDQIAKLEKQQMCHEEIEEITRDLFPPELTDLEWWDAQVAKRDSELKGSYDLTCEKWRSYTVMSNNGPAYLILGPQKLWVGETTHRILDDDGLVHCVPFPNDGKTVLTWQPRDSENPVQF